MEIKTKFNLDDSVWYMNNNIPTNVIISAIETFNVGTDMDHISYNAKYLEGSICWLDHYKIHEKFLFKTKDELCKSMFD